MAKFLPNYQPFTWKNIDTGNPAQFFNGVIQGGESVFDQQRQINEREDSFLTNEALNADRLGIPRAFDRRVDQEKLQQATGYEKTLKSNLLAAGLDRKKTGLEIEQMPEELRLKQEELKTKIANARSAEERNRLQRELNNIALSDAELARKEREQLRGFADNTNSVFEGFLTEAQNEYDARDVPDADTLAGQQARYEATQATAQQQLAQYHGNRQGVKDTGLPAYLRPQTPAGIAETAAAGRQESDDAIIQKYIEKNAIDYRNAYEASENNLNAFIVMPDGSVGFGKPTEHKFSKAKAEIMLGDAASKNDTLKFRLEDLEPTDRQNLSNAAATLSPGIAREITGNVIKQSKVDGGEMNSQEFVKAWNKEAQRYRDKVFPQARKQYADGDKNTYKANELFDLYIGNVTKSGDPRLKDAPPALKDITPKAVDKRIAGLKNSFEDAKSNFESLQNSGYVTFSDKRKINNLYDKLSKGEYFQAQSFAGPYGAVAPQKVKVSFEDREKALVQFNKIVAKYRDKASDVAKQKVLDDRVTAGLK